MIVQTGRFGDLTIGEEELIHIPQGLLGFADLTRYCLVDPGDETLILWLQSVDRPELAFPILEPKIFKPDYVARLSASELRELKLDSVNQSAVFSVVTVPADLTLMSANLKAPLVINLKSQIAKQVVLQENEYTVKYPVFVELKRHLLTIQAQKRQVVGEGATAASNALAQADHRPGGNLAAQAVAIKNIPPSLTVKGLQA